MFTGIVEEVGQVVDVEASDAGLRLVTASSVAHQGTAIGDSIAVNGVCLTVVTIANGQLSFDAVPETLRRSNLGALRLGDAINLERAVSASRPMGGHYVQGHVDATITVRDARPDGDALDVWFDVPSNLLRYIVPKGFVTVDGASLTVVGVDGSGFSVTLIPHTRANVAFGAAPIGYRANLEVDVFSKYVERTVEARLATLEARLSALEDSRPTDTADTARAGTRTRRGARATSPRSRRSTRRA